MKALNDKDRGNGIATFQLLRNKDCTRPTNIAFPLNFDREKRTKRMQTEQKRMQTEQNACKLKTATEDH